MRKEYDQKDGGKERLNASQKGGKKERDLFGRELGMGIPEWDKEAEKAKMVPLKNRFSAQHDCSMSEAMKMVKGRGSSYQEERKDERKTRRGEEEEY